MNVRNWLLAGLGVFAVAQLVPIDRAAPTDRGEVPAPDAVREILERSCYDCHSHRTRWPWYGYIAPVSWLIAYDAHEAREHLNFTAWDDYDAAKQAKQIGEVWEEVEEGEMPLFFYVPLHPEAELSAADLDVLREWAESAGSSDGHSDHDH
jgi:hypothetical protein